MNIFIAGLNYNMSEAELGELFAEYGEVVSVKIIMDRETGRSKGYGFVEMADDEAGDKAIAALNEVDMDGKTLSVSVARPREERPRRSYGKGTGALRKAIQQHLKRIKYVKSFRQGEYGEGDAGVTIVEFKK